MSGDCGHGWGHHYDGPSGPCYACLLNEARKLVVARQYALDHARGRSQHGGRTRALDIAKAKLEKLERRVKEWFENANAGGAS